MYCLYGIMVMVEGVFTLFSINTLFNSEISRLAHAPLVGDRLLASTMCPRSLAMICVFPLRIDGRYEI